MFASLLTPEFLSLIGGSLTGFLFRTIAERRQNEKERFDRTLSLIDKRKEVADASSIKISSIFSENVFTLNTAREYLSDEAFKSLQASIKGSKKIDRTVANQIANGIQDRYVEDHFVFSKEPVRHNTSYQRHEISKEYK